VLLGAACNDMPLPGPPPAFAGGGLVASGTPPPSGALKALEGVYATSSLFGSEVVAHATATTLSLLATPHAAFAVLHAGCLPPPQAPTLVLEGYWRYLDGRDTGLVRLFVDPPAAASAVCAGQPVTAPGITLHGLTGLGAADPVAPLEAGYLRPRKQRTGRFLAGGHRGACQTSAGCAASENSLETLPLAEQLGADLSEMDVQVTRDGVPVIYHDGALNGDLSRGLYCVGKISDLTYAMLLANCRLLGGEKIPTLADALEVAGTKTGLAAVWLDIKSPETVPGAVAAIEAFFSRHPSASLQVLVGLPSADIIAAYEAAPRSDVVRCLIEEDPGDVDRLACTAWGPRFTRGPMPDVTGRLQSEGRLVVYWTIDDPDLMDAFLTSDTPNGILTSLLPMLVHRFEAVGRVPGDGVSR